MLAQTNNDSVRRPPVLALFQKRVKGDDALRLKDVAIQYDKYNFRTGKFEYYEKFYFTVDRDMNYIFFARNDESDMEFNDPGFYRVFLLDEDDKTVASSLIEIID